MSHRRRLREEKKLRLREANALRNVLEELVPFTKLKVTAGLLSIRSICASDLTLAEKTQCFALFEANMKQMYEASEWGYNAQEKRHELFQEEARYLLVQVADTNELVGFVHYRFCFEEDEEDDEDEGECVLYVYEIQLHSQFHRQGVGKRLMQILELVARKHHMEAIMLTVFKSNVHALEFYQQGLKFAIDLSSPSQCDDPSACYEILSKRW